MVGLLHQPLDVADDIFDRHLGNPALAPDFQLTPRCPTRCAPRPKGRPHRAASYRRRARALHRSAFRLARSDKRFAGCKGREVRRVGRLWSSISASLVLLSSVGIKLRTRCQRKQVYASASHKTVTSSYDHSARTGQSRTCNEWPRSLHEALMSSTTLSSSHAVLCSA